MFQTLVLNASYQPINIVEWQDAVVLLYKGHAETLTEWDKTTDTYRHLEYDKSVSNYDKKYVYKIPVIIRCLFNNALPKRKRLRFNRLNLFLRDEFCCMYCGIKFENNSAKGLEIEHVFPQSRGGKTSFENCVAACRECNGKKGDRTPEEAGMILLKKPEIPNAVVLMYKKLNRKKLVHESWGRYLKLNSGIL